MTYKKALAHLIEEAAQNWLGKILEENKPTIGKTYTFQDGNVEFEMEKDVIYWTVKFEIRKEKSYVPYHVAVGGTVDDLVGLCCSVIWASDKRKILWMNVPSTRESLGIKEFQLQ